MTITSTASTRDGTIAEVGQHVLDDANFTPRHAPTGKIVGISGSNVDVIWEGNRRSTIPAIRCRVIHGMGRK